MNNKICGIYKIINTLNGKVYIGQSIDIYNRFKSHINKSFDANSPEYNLKLHRAIRKYGANRFSLEIVEICPVENLNEREIYWIKEYDSVKKGYNIENGGYGVRNCISNDKHFNHKLTMEDVIYIRTCYLNHYRKKDVFKLFKDKVHKCGFDKVWKGATWKNVMSYVYTEENIRFHKFNTANSNEENGRTKLSNKDVYEIRIRKKNGESLSAVYQDYKDKVTAGSFKNIWCYCNWKNIIV